MTPRRRTSRWRGLTLLELLVALGLAVVVMAAAMSVFAMIPLAERRAGKGFDERVDLLIAQSVIRRALDTLVGARPISQEQAQMLSRQASIVFDAVERQGNQDTPNADEPDNEAAEDSADNSINDRLTPEQEKLLAVAREAGGDEERLTQLLLQTAMSDLPNFELHFETNEYGTTLPRLEIVVMQSPVPDNAGELSTTRSTPRGMTGSMPIRGAFEIVQLDEELILQWQPIDPPGLGTILIPNLAWVEWSALPNQDNDEQKQGWVDVAAAYLQEDYPAAVRLVMWTRDGTYVDWLFETGVVTPAPQRLER